MRRYTEEYTLVFSDSMLHYLQVAGNMKEEELGAKKEKKKGVRRILGPHEVH